MDDLRSSALFRIVRAVLRCGLPICVIGIAFALWGSGSTWKSLDRLRAFSPKTLASLYRDSATECVEQPPALPPPDARSGSGTRTNQPIRLAAIEGDQLTRSELLVVRCVTTPIIGEWPRVGHWGAKWGGWGVPPLLIAPFDVGWHLVGDALLQGQFVPAAICMIEIAIGFAISYMLANRYASDRTGGNPFAALLFLLAGTLGFGVLFMWIAMNLVAFLYCALTPLFPKVRDAGITAIVTFLFVQCASLGLILKRWDDRVADLAANKTSAFIERK